MAELTDTQRQVLITASKRKGGFVLPVASNLKGGVLKKVLSALLSSGTIEETPAGPDQEIWRTSDEGVRLTLKLTKTGRQAVGGKRKASVKKDTKPTVSARRDTKQAKVIAMLKRPSGATVDQIMKATGWQPHTVRGFFAGALKKRLGIEVTSEKREDGARVYRIVP
jgi:Protein of unknown function (DUF3489)